MSHRRNRGFTMIEVMMTLVILAIVISIGYITLSGFLPKQRLTRVASDIENILVRAQAEAFSRSRVVGVQFSTDGAELFLDNSDQPGNTPWVRDANDYNAITKISFPPDIRLVEDTCNPFRVSGCSMHDCAVWFDQTGQAVTVDTTTIPPTITPDNYQLIVASNKLATGYSAREVEVFSSGLVELVKLGQMGSAGFGTAAQSWANQPPGAGSNCPP